MVPFSEGVKEADRRSITSVLQNVASVKENAYYLLKNLWSEVDEDWPFYSEEEKAMIQRYYFFFFFTKPKLPITRGLKFLKFRFINNNLTL